VVFAATFALIVIATKNVGFYFWWDDYSRGCHWLKGFVVEHDKSGFGA